MADPFLPFRVRHVCFVGAGYVGGPTAAVIALHNRAVRVTVVDRDEAKIGRWNSQHPPIYEPGLQEILRITRDGSKTFQFNKDPEGTPASPDVEKSHAVVSRLSNLVFSTEVEKSIRAADIVFICVSTPTKKEGEGAGSSTDMTAFNAVIALVIEHLRPGAIIVDKSTVPVRTAVGIERKLWDTFGPARDLNVLSNPEFLAAGTAIKDLLHPPRVIIGFNCVRLSSKRAALALASLYNWVPKDKIILTDNSSSELSKLVANAMLAQRISSINSVAAICDATGADVDEVARAIGSDERIGPYYLRAGLGFGGSCFKKDLLSLIYLANTLDLSFVSDYWQAVINMNESSRSRLVQRLVAALGNSLAGKKITIIGYAFKSNTDDTRESPAYDIIRALSSSNTKEISVYDPCCRAEHIEDEIEALYGPGVAGEQGAVYVSRDPQTACKGAHAIVITTEFQDFVYDVNDAVSAPKPTLPDPRPFKGTWPTEAEVLALHYFLRQALPVSSSHMNDDPLGQFNPMPPCKDDCLDCRDAANKAGEIAETAREKLNWTKVRDSMKEPCVVYDCRGVINVAKMEDMGFIVETVGRQRKPPSEMS